MRLSDQSPFWAVGYDAMMVIDTLDLVFLAAVIDGLDATLRRV